MPNLSWRDAVIEVLKTSPQAMNYVDIAEAIVDLKLRTEFGATPAISVNVTISSSLQKDGLQSPFVRVSQGTYWLRSLSQAPPATPLQTPDSESAVEEAGLINAFGMYWARDGVLWTTSPKILGQQQVGATAVDFCNQHGVYLLYDGRAVVYVGRTTDQPIGARLRQHTSDRLNGRWNRFSWFGVYEVAEDASLRTGKAAAFSQDMLIATMEALLIEGVEPPQNRKRGDDFRAVEYLQVVDPSIQKSQVLKLMDELKSKL
jgi:hypothetical protein